MASQKILTHSKIRKLQRTLYQQAKSKPDWKAWSLYAELCREEFIEEAMYRVHRNHGIAGIDGYTVDQMGEEWVTFRDSLQKELKEKTYTPSPLLRKLIPKGEGKTRQLSVPTVKDRVVQGLVKLISKRISDGSILKLIKSLLRVNSIEEDRKQRKRPPSKKRGKQMRKPKKIYKHLLKSKVGVPQGGVLSPLMGNIFLDALDKGVNSLNPRDVKMVRFADDFVITVKPGLENVLLERTEEWLTQVGLRLNQEKTKSTDTSSGGRVEFLGFELSERTSPKSGNRYIHRQPSKKSECKYRDKIRSILSHSTTWKDADKVIKEVNSITRGWGNYFHYGMSVASFRRQNYYLMQKMRYWLRSKHTSRSGKRGFYSEYPDKVLTDELRLQNLPLNLNLRA